MRRRTMAAAAALTCVALIGGGYAYAQTDNDVPTADQANAALDQAQAGIEVARAHINNRRTTTTEGAPSSTSTTPASTTTSSSEVTTPESTTTSVEPATTEPPSSTTSPTDPPAPDASGCGLTAAAFCETFDAAATPPGVRTGALDPTLWGVSRLGGAVNPGPYNDTVADAYPQGCGPTDPTNTPDDVRICDGKMFETVNDGGGVANLDTYPKQPFDFAGRTGTVVFDVSADSDGTHAAWPEFVITDKPVPGARGEISNHVQPGAANEVGFDLAGCAGATGDTTGVANVWTVKNHVYSEPPFTHDGCITKGTFGTLNHIEVHVSANSLEVFGTNPGSTELVELAHADNLGLTLTRGLVWLDDVHYNARKAVEPCECGDQYNHTFAWDNLGFDGPKTYRDIGFDVPDADVANTSLAGDPARDIGYQLGSPRTFTLEGVGSAQAPTAAQVVFNFYTYDQAVPTVQVNDGAPIATAWPYQPSPQFEGGDGGYSLRTISVPVPVAQVHEGTNTVTFTGTGTMFVANISLILVAGAPVP